MIERKLFSAQHKIIRAQVTRFIEREIDPFREQWRKDRQAARKTWIKAGSAGLLCPSVPHEYVGVGARFLFSAIVLKEFARVGATGLGFEPHWKTVAPYISFPPSAGKTHCSSPEGPAILRSSDS